MTDLIHEFARRHRWNANFSAAKHELKLTPQEEYAYRHHLANLERGGVPHPDGSLSSFLNMTFAAHGKHYVIPTVWDNQIVSPQVAWKRAVQGGLDKWPSYPNDKAADARYNQIHGYMERDTERKLNAAPPKGAPDAPVPPLQPGTPAR
jgi:hypothetical protein